MSRGDWACPRPITSAVGVESPYALDDSVNAADRVKIEADSDTGERVVKIESRTDLGVNQ